ncbi:MAG: hypothetical protein ISP33_02990 [Ilumatobacteraceae bacterium]|nr:hypothetical protein [Ilumatobacteraceae bacterium]
MSLPIAQRAVHEARKPSDHTQRISLGCVPSSPPSTVARLAPKKVVLGVIDLGRDTVETPDEVAARIRGALDHIAPENLAVSPDCGMKYLPRERARAKLAAMVAGAAMVRDSIG